MKPDFKRSVETDMIEKLLAERYEAQDERTLTYSELSELIGMNILEHRHWLSTARHSRERDGQTWATVTRIGVKPVFNSGEVVELAETKMGRVAGVVRGARRTINCAKFSELDGEKKTKALALQARIAATELFQRQASRKKLLTACREMSNEMPVGKTLELFRGGQNH